MLYDESRLRSHLGWAAVNGQTTRCAAQPPDCTLASQPDSRVNGDRPASPELDDNLARTPLGTARRVGD